MDSLRPFLASDFDDYRTWFADADLDRWLGPLDQEWLDAVLGEDPPAQFVLWRAGARAAVLGIVRPELPGQPHVITDVAVDPARRGRGLGRTIIDAVLAQENPSAHWRTYVEPANLRARAFFTRLGWSEVSSRGLPSGEEVADGDLVELARLPTA